MKCVALVFVLVCTLKSVCQVDGSVCVCVLGGRKKMLLLMFNRLIDKIVLSTIWPNVSLHSWP